MKLEKKRGRFRKFLKDELNSKKINRFVLRSIDSIVT